MKTHCVRKITKSSFTLQAKLLPEYVYFSRLAEIRQNYITASFKVCYIC